MFCFLDKDYFLWLFCQELFLLFSLGVHKCLAVFIASRTAIGSTVLSYVGDTQVEVRKVVWPTRQETLQTTLIVLLMVMLVALMLWAFDSLLGWAVRSLML